MAQSYGNSATSSILAAVDEITGVDISTQEYGTSLSRRGPSLPALGASTLLLKVDGAPAVVAAWTTSTGNGLFDTAAAIQAQVRAAGVGDAYTKFVARLDTALDKIILESGTKDAVPANPASRVEVTGGNAAPFLKLGVAVGGIESSSTSPYIAYVVRYRYVYDAGKNFGSDVIEVLSTRMMIPTDVTEAVTIANSIAAQRKVVGEDAGEVATISTDSENGPVSL